LYLADGFSQQHRLSRRPSPKRCAQTKLRHRNLYWRAGCQSRRPRQSDTYPARESPFGGATARHYSSGEAAGAGANRSTAQSKGRILIRRDIWRQIAQLRVSEPSQAADSFAGVPTASP
jgi:hypothetical protein